MPKRIGSFHEPLKSSQTKTANRENYDGRRGIGLFVFLRVIDQIQKIRGLHVLKKVFPLHPRLLPYNRARVGRSVAVISR
jgi:3-deoxy-D-manno-octulosonic acid (KDO) 8-phosphate synthase